MDQIYRQKYMGTKSWVYVNVSTLKCSELWYTNFIYLAAFAMINTFQTTATTKEMDLRMEYVNLSKVRPILTFIFTNVEQNTSVIKHL